MKQFDSVRGVVDDELDEAAADLLRLRQQVMGLRQLAHNALDRQRFSEWRATLEEIAGRRPRRTAHTGG